ncbi:CAF1-domain-containing protein [Pseudovirgaria hyperparasitica]|uniref:poly(A)-specific ribonuclease n=1 Tax=Pseudovirgaria hyperparasitica TaxID=470096 RepID=A0A6A6W104_9PEZI|nr:CAF1-domain-containing protein [Pseudovirgaria hyperparasitica]KAF2756223.1 CAF1-domain-containing protein [Pseudovirgaria hyperparasitica]
MARPGGRFAPQNMSNPYNNFNQNALQSSHLPHPGQNIPSQNLGGHPGFGGANPNLNAFTSSNDLGLGGGFGSSAGFRGSGGGTGLDSQTARAGFAHGAALQQQQAHEAAGMGGLGTKALSTRIREVWKTNLAQEMEMLRNLIEKYPYISMDTEFPGVVARPMGEFPTKASYHYQTVRCNVDLLKIIQLGVTLFNIEGEVPPVQLEAGTIGRPGYGNNLIMCPTTWSFNFSFNLEDDMYNEESISMLKKSGADFDKHSQQGIDPLAFGSLLISSGLVLNEDVHWLSFHSGYDFAYLVKIMWSQQLPADEEDYRELVAKYFPSILDVKFLWRHARNLLARNQLSSSAVTILSNLGTKSGLQDLADELGCQRVGTQHSAGSDAWLTGTVFFQMKNKIFDGQIPHEMNGQMWGLTGVGAPASAAAQAAAMAAQGHSANGNPALANAFQMGYHTNSSNTQRDGAPSTPTTNAAGLASGTPGPGHGHGLGSMTPGGGSGVFGNFSYKG